MERDLLRQKTTLIHTENPATTSDSGTIAFIKNVLKVSKIFKSSHVQPDIDRKLDNNEQVKNRTYYKSLEHNVCICMYIRKQAVPVYQLANNTHHTSCISIAYLHLCRCNNTRGKNKK